MGEVPKISDEAIRVAAEAIEDRALLRLGRDLGTVHRDEIVHAGLCAAYPLLRQQWEAERDEQDGRLSAVVAETIAQEIEARALKVRQGATSASAGMAIAAVLEEGALIAREVGARAGRPNGTEVRDA